MSTKVKFRILSCSGEDKDNPVSELLTTSPQSKGWQSPRFCDYPQEINFQFISPIRLKQIQFLSHQSKIASKIEIYVFMPDPNAPNHNIEFKYKKLGFLSLDSNERSGYQARELKSVYLDHPALYMKLIIHKCHMNKYNLFNQVGLIALSVYGDHMEAQFTGEDPASRPGGVYNQLEYESQYDSTTLDRLKALQTAKERAIKFEDFEEAKRIKEAMDKLIAIGKQLQVLEERKATAISNEDFDSAKIIKAEIDRLRTAMAPETILGKYATTTAQGQLPPVQYASHRPWSGSKDPLGMPSDMKKLQSPTMTAYGNFDENEAVSRFNAGSQQGSRQGERGINMSQERATNARGKVNSEEMFSRPEDELEKNPKDLAQRSQYGAGQAFPKSEPKNKVFQEEFVSHDEQVIPTMANNRNKQFDDEVNDRDGNQQSEETAEKLSPANMKLAQPLLPVFGDATCQNLFSKTWTLREKALKHIDSQLRKPVDINMKDVHALWNALFGAVNYTINDKIAQVVQSSVGLLRNLLNQLQAPKSMNLSEFQNFSNSILYTLLDKIGDNNVKLREAAEESIVLMAICPLIGPRVCVDSCLVIEKKVNNKTTTVSHKHIAGRLSVLTKIVKEFQIGNANVPFQPVVEFAIRQLEHQNEAVRNAAIALLVEVYVISGELKMRPFLENVRPVQMEILQNEFDRVAEGGGAGNKMVMGNSNNKSEPKKEPAREKKPAMNDKENSSAPKTKHNKTNSGDSDKQKQQKENAAQNKPGANASDVKKVCEFCGKYNEDFADTAHLDMHLWRECPMLTTCKLCQQVVEIATMNTHLLEECEQKKKVKKCPRCKEAILVPEYDQHVKAKTCVPPKNGEANRCVLCHTDLPPGAKSWRTHLVTEGCPGNT